MNLPSNNLVLLVADTVWPRVCKIGYGLRSNGIDVVLLYSEELMNDNHSECFDAMYRYSSAEEAISLALQYSPLACHVFSSWNFQTAFALIYSGVPNIIFDSYDVLAGLVKPEFASLHYPQAVDIEKFCLENARGVTCRALTLQPAKHDLNYSFKNGILYFPDYCWDSVQEPAPPRGDSQTHLVYAGGLNIEKLAPNDNHRNGWYFLEFAKMAAAEQIHFHLYPVPLYDSDFDETFSDYRELEAKTEYFHLHRSIKSNALAEELGQYDYGLISVWSGFRHNNLAYSPEMSKYLTSNKFFDYLDSGLGIIVNTSSRLLKWYTEKNRVGFAANLEDVLGGIKSAPPGMAQTAKNNAVQARGRYAVAKHAVRLIRYYASISDARQNQTVRPPELQDGAAPTLPAIQRREGTAMKTPSGSLGGNPAVSVASPRIFAIETTLACDLRCPECAIGGGMVERAKGLMSFEHYKIIADKIAPYAEYVYLHIWGEPMLNPDIFRMIEYTARFAKSNISTNGQSMTPAMAERLIHSGVNDIIVSIDGATQETYEQYRVGGSLGKAFEALEMLQHFNSKNGNRVNIAPQFIVFKHNQHQMEEFSKRGACFGLEPYFKAPYIRKKDSRFQYSDFPEYARPHFPNTESLKSAMAGCSAPKDVFNVLVDGTVVACCHDYGGFTNFGNIFTGDIMEIWNGATMGEFRTALASGNTPDFCLAKCMTYFLDEAASAPEDARIRAAAQPESGGAPLNINLCSGPVKVDGYVGIDISPAADITLDLEKDLIPFPDNSADVVACISAINYFSTERAQEIVGDVLRVLKPGGVARFASQDLRVLAAKYLSNDQGFFFEKLADGRDRFPGRTIADKLNGFFYGFYSGDKHCKYVYDFASLEALFVTAGFEKVEEKKYRQSVIPDVDKLDNRPEQMFFLEAVKARDDGGYYRERALGLAQSDPERSWQCLMKALEIDPADRNALVAALNILLTLKHYDYALKLCSVYLEKRPGDDEIGRFAQQVRQQAEQQNQEFQALAKARQPQLDGIDVRTNRVLPSPEHLAACMTWLRRAQDIHRGGGVSALYHMDEERWGVDYPETTGYIIPTFLAYANLTGNGTWRTRAIQMGDWEIAIQSPEGGAGEPVGVSGFRPRVFNTGQVLLGWVALYRATSAPRFLDAARKAADWIVSSQDADGKWVRNTYSGEPKAYKSRVAWALLELYDVTGDERYRAAAESAVAWILAQAEPNGWFANNSLTDPERPWTHLIGYVLVGLHEIYRLDNARIDRAGLLELLHKAAVNMAGFYGRQKNGSGYTTLPGTFDRTWQSRDGWSCITGNAQLEFFLRRLAEDTGDARLLEAADNLLVDLKQIHLMDGITDPALFGGLQGAYPARGPYCTYLIPNWGVKFFADSLLQSISPLADRTCLG